jgi:hypothetical protein
MNISVRALQFLLILLVTFFLSPKSFAQNDLSFGNDNTVKGNIHVGDEIKYSGLSQQQAAKLRTLDIQMKQVLNQVIALNQSNLEAKVMRDSVVKLSQLIASYQLQIDRLQAVNDSIINSRRNDSIFRVEIEKNYQIKLKENLGQFWEANPNFNPDDYNTVIQYLKSKQNKSIQSFSSTNGNGIRYQGVKYFFQGQGLHTVYGWEGQNISKLPINIPGHGTFSLGTLKLKYNEYHRLVNNKESIFQDQIVLYRNNTNLTAEEAAAGNKNCQGQLGNIEFTNTTSEKIYLWYCPGNSVCSRHRTQNHYTIFPGQTQSLYDLTPGVYSYGSMKGNGLLYGYKNGQIKVTKCHTQKIAL